MDFVWLQDRAFFWICVGGACVGAMLTAVYSVAWLAGQLGPMTPHAWWVVASFVLFTLLCVRQARIASSGVLRVGDKVVFFNGGRPVGVHEISSIDAKVCVGHDWRRRGVWVDFTAGNELVLRFHPLSSAGARAVSLAPDVQRQLERLGIGVRYSEERRG